jgi:nucleoside phosphorylase
MGLVSHDEILKLRAAVISARLTESRAALLTGVDPDFVAALPNATTPGDQVLRDLDTLNVAGSLTDGSVPLAIWLSNAVASAGLRAEAAVFHAALGQLRGPGPPRPPERREAAASAGQGRQVPTAPLAPPGMAMALSDVKGKVDFGIITIREDEFEAVLERLPKYARVTGRRQYNLRRVELPGGEAYLVAVIRCVEQGLGEAQSAAHDLLEEMDPQWLLVVGIAGAVPSDDFSLGDVVVSTRIHDFSVEAVLHDRAPEYALAGGPVHKASATIAANLPALKDELGLWNSPASIVVQRPPVEVNEASFYGNDGWSENVRKSLLRHAARPAPVVTTGAIASSDRLIKDTEIVAVWLKMARQVSVVEMESAGVYRAAHGASVPVLAIRGISDVVGFTRDSRWTGYACHTAAAFTRAFLLTRPIPPRGGDRAVRAPGSPQIRPESPSVAGTDMPHRASQLVTRQLPGLLTRVVGEPAPVLIRSNVPTKAHSNLSPLDQWTFVCEWLSKSGLPGVVYTLHIIDAVQDTYFSDGVSRWAADFINVLLTNMDLGPGGGDGGGGDDDGGGGDVVRGLRRLISNEARRWDRLKQEVDILRRDGAISDDAVRYATDMSRSWLNMAQALLGPTPQDAQSAHGSQSAGDHSKDLANERIA